MRTRNLIRHRRPARPHWQLGPLLLLGLLLVLVCARTARGQFTPRTELLGIELYVREDSEQCQKARDYLAELVKRHPGLSVRVLDVVEDRDALKRLWALAKRFGRESAKVPTIYMTDRLWVGFDEAATTGQSLESGMVIHAYIRPTCPHCQAAKVFLDDLNRRWPAIAIRYHDVSHSREALDEVQRLAVHYRTSAASLPCIQVADRFLVGYQSAQTTGRRIESYLRIPAAAPQEVAGRLRTQPFGWASAATRNATQPASAEPRRAAGLNFTAVFATLSQEPASEDPEPEDPAQEEQPSLDGLPPVTDVEQDGASLPLPDEAEPLPIPDEAELPIPGEADVPEAGNGRSPPALPTEETLSDPARPSADGAPQGIEVELFDQTRRLTVRDYGLPAFTFLIGLVDGFNPCAMWVLIFLLSVLVNIQDRKKILVIAGAFVVVSGLAYYAFMAAWLNVFELIGLQRPVQIGLGLLAVFAGLVNVKDFFAFRRGVTLSIPDSAKPGIARRVHKIVSSRYLGAALLGAIVLAVLVNVIELLCTAGLPAMYTQILTMQQLPGWANYGYLGLYIVAYMLDDTLMLAVAVITLSNRRMQESEGRWLKFLSGLVILALGLVMLFRPEWLASGV